MSERTSEHEIAEPVNVLGEPLAPCSIAPRTGFYRTGRCDTGRDDVGRHVICVEVTAEFLSFSRMQGNDLTTEVPELGFRGLSPGDRWCVCAARWKEALESEVAPPVILAATHREALQVVTLEELIEHALDVS